jgi:beta-glucosidase-like glycosyl hydrolase
VALAATWNAPAARRYGNAIGSEAFATGLNVQLGPAADIDRVPVAGRTFEAYGEDPSLQGRTAVQTIRGTQAHPVASTIHHYNLYNQEFERLTISSEVDERTVHRWHLPRHPAGRSTRGPLTVMPVPAPTRPSATRPTGRPQCCVELRWRVAGKDPYP